MEVHIIRDETSEQGTLGKMYIDGVYFCETLQPDEDDKNRFYIPSGHYLCKRFHGVKWPNTFEIICPPHTALLFHAGNVETDSLGCILLGSERGKLQGNRAVLNSGVTFKKFLKVTGNVNELGLLIENKD